MELYSIIAALNPATGTQLPIWLFVVSGVVLAGCIVGAIISNKMKNKKTKKNGRRK